MGLLKRALSVFPSHKHCGCKESVDGEFSYQFRVRATDDNSHQFQLRHKKTCQHCEGESVKTLVEGNGTYDPTRSGTTDDMIDYGFMDESEMAEVLIEMRLTNSLEPDI